MENPGYQRDAEKALEMKESKKLNKPSKESNGTSATESVTGSIVLPSTSCKPEACQAARRKYSPPDFTGSPWHRNKTVFLVTFLVLLGVWIVVYTTLSQLKVL